LIGFEHLYYLLAIIPVFIAGWILVKRGANHSLIMSRVSVISLLIIALAGPYNPLIVTETDDTPSITVLSDETESMDLFEEGTAQEIFERLQGQTPVTMERMKGLRSDIGDEILFASERNYHVVVVSDGNNNFGRALGESIDFASDTGTSIYAITQTPLRNDLSVEITGGKTSVVGNDNLVGIEVRQALSDAKYDLTIFKDGTLYKKYPTITQKTNKRTIVCSIPFSNEGRHNITASISSKDDTFAENNVFDKTIFVVPKPKILLITSDLGSPLYNNLSQLYNLDILTSIENVELEDYKTVILGNMHNKFIGNVDKLRNYIANGGGLLVIGGDNSYDYGEYLGSELETILPVESYSSTYSGSTNIVLVLDTSGSVTTAFTSEYNLSQTENLLQYEKAIAMDLVENQLNDNTNVGLVIFGKSGRKLIDGTMPLSSKGSREILSSTILNFNYSLKGGETSYFEGLDMADTILTENSLYNNVIIISDGAFSFEVTGDKYFMEEYTSVKNKAIDMINEGTVIYFTHIVPVDPGVEFPQTYDSEKNDYYFKLLAEEVGGGYEKIPKGQSIKFILDDLSEDTTSSESEEYALVRLDEDHFITRYLNISGSISGYNDVTQKVGANRLITTSMGKPVVTSWQFGLGRVVSLSTDSGNSWAGGQEGLYSGENARLLPSIINWVVGDPQPDKGLVVFSSDMYLGFPGTITVFSDTLPSVSFDGQEVSMTRTEDRSFEGVLNPVSQGVFSLVVTAGGERIDDLIAVNYPMEYRDVGNNPEFLEAVKRNKGGVYYPEQATSLLFDDIMTNSVRTTVEHVDLRWIALLLALIVFLSEVIVRRVHGIIDIKDRRKGV
jgi:uncharacterized membrane protein